MFLFLVGGFWAYEFYTFYQDLTTFSGFLNMVFSSSEPLAMSFLSFIGINIQSYQSYNQAVNIVEGFLVTFVIITIIGFIVFIVGAATNKKKKTS